MSQLFPFTHRWFFQRLCNGSSLQSMDPSQASRSFDANPSSIILGKPRLSYGPRSATCNSGSWNTSRTPVWTLCHRLVRTEYRIEFLCFQGAGTEGGRITYPWVDLGYTYPAPPWPTLLQYRFGDMPGCLHRSTGETNGHYARVRESGVRERGRERFAARCGGH